MTEAGDATVDRSEGQALEELVGFLRGSFSADELRKLATYHLGLELASQLPDGSVGLDEVAHRFAVLCRQTGHINTELFNRLERERGKKHEAIARLRQRFGAVSKPAPGGIERDPLARSPPRRMRSPAPPRRWPLLAVTTLVAGACGGYLLAHYAHRPASPSQESSGHVPVFRPDPAGALAIERCAQSFQRLPRDAELARTQTDWIDVVGAHVERCAPLLTLLDER